MWLMLNNCFLSIVSKDCRRDELMVRARRRGDIKKVFTAARVVHTPYPADYRYRAVVKRTEVAKAIAAQVDLIDYGNFKDSVRDDRLHNAYMRVWGAMLSIEQHRHATFFDRDNGLNKPRRRKRVTHAD